MNISQRIDLLHWTRKERTPEALMVLADWYEEDSQLYMAEELRFLSSLLQLLLRVKQETSVPSRWLMDTQRTMSVQPAGACTLRATLSGCLLQVESEVDGFIEYILNQEVSYVWDPWNVMAGYHRRHTPEEYMPLF